METVPCSIDLAKREIRDALAVMKSALQKVLPEAAFTERERAALLLSNEAVRQTLEADLQDLADEYGEHVLVDGVEYKAHELGNVSYHSLVGPLLVSRATFREVGVRNGPTVVPLDLVAA